MSLPDAAGAAGGPNIVTFLSFPFTGSESKGPWVDMIWRRALASTYATSDSAQMLEDLSAAAQE